MRASTSLYRADSFRGKCSVALKELCVFARENVVCDAGDVEFFAESHAEG
jgi:hypothetical protein